ncbi:acetyltransferase [Verrucomicrobia bacterium]|nr:acetyltransferase [Verrucomicrobiota bacterium]
MTEQRQKKMYILGAGGFARELYSYLQESSFRYGDYDLAGFLADSSSSLEGFKFAHQVVGPIRYRKLRIDDVVMMGVSSCELKKELHSFYSELGINIISYIHPTASIGHDVIVGEGSVFGPYALATTNVGVGKCSTINALSTLGHDSVLGDFCTLSGHCDVTGGVRLGDEVFLGSHVSIMPKIVVGSNVIIGIGSVVVKNVMAGITVFGNPARKIK